MNGDTESAVELRQHARTGINELVRRGRIVAFGIVGLFVLAGTVIPMSSAVVAKGEVISDGRNKKIQHPAGGTIRSIEVADGVIVKKGQLLMVLNPAVSQADLSELKARRAVLVASKRRLETVNPAGEIASPLANWGLRDGDGVEGLPPDPTVISSISPDPDVPYEISQAQNSQLLYGSRSDAAEHMALLTQAERMKQEKKGLADRLKAKQKALASVRDERKRMAPLVRSKYMAEKRLWDLEREENSLAAEVADLKTNALSLGDQIEEARLKADAFEAGRFRDASQELTKVLGELGQIRDRITSAELALSSTEIRAPVDGTIVNMSANTVGGVVRSGEVIGEIVPQDAELIVQVRLDRKDIAYVKEGQAARAVITALDRRAYDPVDSRVSYISADSIPPSQTDSTGGLSQPSYIVRAELLNAPVDAAGRSVLKPGMPVDLFVNAGNRPFLTYLMKPFVTSFERAFREP